MRKSRAERYCEKGARGAGHSLRESVLRHSSGLRRSLAGLFDFKHWCARVTFLGSSAESFSGHLVAILFCSHIISAEEQKKKRLPPSGKQPLQIQTQVQLLGGWSRSLFRLRSGWSSFLWRSWGVLNVRGWSTVNSSITAARSGLGAASRSGWGRVAASRSRS